MKRLLLATLLSTTALTLTSHAYADPITVTNVAIPNSDEVGLHYGPLNETVYAGIQYLTTSVGTLETLCLDIFHDNPIGATNQQYSLGSALDDGGHDPLSQSQTTAINHLMAYAVAITTGTAKSPFPSLNDTNMLIQSAVWLTEYGNGLTINSGDPNFKADIATVEKDSQAYTTILQQMTSLDGHQNLIVDAVIDPVPEPDTLAILGIGLVALGTITYARKSSSRIGGPGTPA